MAAVERCPGCGLDIEGDIVHTFATAVRNSEANVWRGFMSDQDALDRVVDSVGNSIRALIENRDALPPNLCPSCGVALVEENRSIWQ